MKRGSILGVALGLGLTAFAGLAGAQEPTAVAASAAPSDGHASGLLVQGRMQQGGLASLGGAPSFLLGYQGAGFAAGLGLGLNRIGVSTPRDGSASLMLFQIMPTALIDVWRSADGRARANLIGGVGYGRGSVSATDTSQSCVDDGFGNTSCTTQSRDTTASAGFVPVMLGFGGDYFIGRNFALGAEVGLQAAFITSIDTDSGSTSQSVDASGNLQLAYGALRATFVLGD